MTNPSIATTKTEVETALSAHALERLPRLPGGAANRKAREEARAEFERLGLPHRRIEEWKFTDFRSLLKSIAPNGGATDAKAAAQHTTKSHALTGSLTFVFADGKLVSAPTKLPQGLTVDSFAHRLEPEPNLLTAPLPSIVDQGAASLIALNASLVTDGAVVRVAPGTKIAEPIQLIFANAGLMATRNRLDIGAGAELTVVETHVQRDAKPTSQQNLNHTVITVGDGARVNHVMDHALDAGTLVFASTVATLGQQAQYAPFLLHIGEGVARHQFTITFKGEYATFDFGGVALASGRGHADTTMVIDHAVPNCTSRELFKTVLNGHGRSIFQGKVIVRPDAQKTDGKQMAQALMLSPTAEFDAKPELEIYADDVVCGHGATSAEIDADQMFYLRARGIPESEARALLIEGFLGEALDKIPNDILRDTLSTRAIAWLRATTPQAKV